MEDKKTRWVLALLFLGVLMGALDISIVGPAIPAIEDSMQVDKQQISWVFSIYILANLTGISLMARLSDIYGRRNIYILSLLVFSAGSFIVASSHHFGFLLTGRAVQGFGASGIFPVASAVVGDIFPPEKRGRVLGLIGAVFGIAFIIGPVIAGVILKFFVWNDLFYINLPIAAFLIYGSYRYLPSKPISGVKMVDWKGILLLGIFLATLAIGLNRIKPEDFFRSLISPLVLVFFGISIAALFLLIISERSSSSPVINQGLLSVRQVRITGLIAIGTGLFQASFVFLPSMAVAVYGVDTSTASFMLLPVVIATAIGSPVSGRLLDKYGSRILVMSGLILASGGFLAVSLATGNKSVYYLGGIFIGLGFSILSGSALRYIMLNEVSESERASTQGVITIFVSIGQITGSAFIGVLLASFANLLQGFSITFLIISSIAALLAFSSLLLRNHEAELKAIRSNITQQETGN